MKNLGKERPLRMPTSFEAYFTIAFMIVVIGVGASVFEANIKVLLLICAAVNILIAYRCGVTWEAIEKNIGETVGGLGSTIVIILLIGFVISSWMVSGTAPALVYWLSALISAKYIIVLSFVLTTIMSMLIGTSFATMGTLGIVMFSAGIAQGLPAGVVAAAVICGANVGQFLSPLADCVSFNAGVNKISIYKHIKLLSKPVMISVILSVVFFFFCGIKFTATGIGSTESIELLRSEIAANFNVSMITILPLVLAIVLCFLKAPPAIALFSSGILALVIGTFVQGFGIVESIEAAWSGFNSSMLGNANISENLANFLNRGGSFSMADSVLFMVLAMGAMGILEIAGVFKVIQNALFKNVTNAKHLTITTALFSSIFTVITTNSWTACAVTAEAMREPYIKAGNDPGPISAITAACTYMVEQFLPWAFLAIYSASVFGITVLDYVPWAVFFPLVAILTIVIYSVKKPEPFVKDIDADTSAQDA